MRLKNKGMILEFIFLGIVFAVAGSLTYYWGFRSYIVSGEVTDLEVTKDGRHLVTLNGNQKLVIHLTAFMRSEYTPTELYSLLVIGNSYNFLCWGETPHIYGIAP